MREWNPIETAPKDGTRVLITNAGDGMIVDVGCYVVPEHRASCEPPLSNWWRVGRGTGFGMIPTHWMPLPAAPSKAKQAEPTS